MKTKIIKTSKIKPNDITGTKIEVWNITDCQKEEMPWDYELNTNCLLYTSPSPRDATLSRMPSSA